MKFIFFLLMMFFFCRSYSQQNEFNLSDYKLPDLKRKALEMNFDLSGNNRYYQSPSISINSYDASKTNSYNGNFRINYWSYLNNKTTQKEINSAVELSSQYYNNKVGTEVKQEYFRISPILHFSIMNRKYYKTNKFFETDFYFSYSFQNNNNSNNSSGDNSKSDDKFHTVYANFPVKIGIGRIEQVQDARHALYLYDELAKQNRVTVNKSNEEILALSKLISELKNKRFFDSRIRRMYEIEAIDSFLTANKFVILSDCRYFTTLTDFWDYGNRQTRNSGTRIAGCFNPGYYFSDSNSNYGDSNWNDTFSRKTNTFLFNAGFELMLEKPINRSWQNSIDLKGFGGIIMGKTTTFENRIQIPNIQVSYKQSLGFYPNTRTDVTYSYSLNYIQLFRNSGVENIENFNLKGLGIKGTSSLTINYYISQQLKLTLSSSLFYIYQDSDNAVIYFDNLYLSTSNLTNYNTYYKQKDLLHNFQVSLVYSIY